MGFRFRKSIKILPGLRLNVSRKGIGVSAGVKGFRISAGPTGVRRTITIPGTGVSISNKLFAGSQRKETSTSNKSTPQSHIPLNASSALPRLNSTILKNNFTPKMLLASIVGVTGCLAIGITSLFASSLALPSPTEPTINMNNIVSTSFAQYTQQAIVTQMFLNYTQTAVAQQAFEQKTMQAQVVPTLPPTPFPSKPTVAIPTIVVFTPTLLPVPTIPQPVIVAPAVPPANEEPVQNQGCCKVCSNSKPCGDSCISVTKNCTKPPGCACGG